MTMCRLFSRYTMCSNSGDYVILAHANTRGNMKPLNNSNKDLVILASSENVKIDYYVNFYGELIIFVK